MRVAAPALVVVVPAAFAQSLVLALVQLVLAVVPLVLALVPLVQVVVANVVALQPKVPPFAEPQGTLASYLGWLVRLLDLSCSL